MLVPLLVVMTVLFGGLFLFLRTILTRLASQTTGHLKALSQETFLQQETLKKRLEEAERQYQEAQAKAQEEARQLKSQALKEAEASRQQLLEQGRQEAQRIVAQAIQARELLQHELTQSFEFKAVDRACELLKEVLPPLLRESTHTQWLDELIDNGLIKVEHLETQEKVREARVVSAFALTPSQRKLLLERLKTALGSEVTLQEEVNPDVIAGLIITLGHLVLDGSLASKLKEAARRAQDTNA